MLYNYVVLIKIELKEKKDKKKDKKQMIMVPGS